ncbi:MAG: hypothetical protein QOI73_2149, partial [Solirubrobacteraceae bacterium]|nr:hypothetical protein [Solirubrobacteraceae bacterium]
MRRARILGCASIAALLLLVGAGPASATAPEVTRAGGGLLVSGAFTSEDLYLRQTADGRLELTGLALNGAAIPSDCTWDGTWLGCPLPAGLDIRLGAGDDSLDARGLAVPMTIDDGAGDDLVQGGSVDTTFLNGEGDDDFVGGGRDRFVGGPGADRFAGDGGLDRDDFLDTLSYATETQPVHASASALPDGDDGIAGEGDSIGYGVERIVGGSAGDVVDATTFRAIEGGAGDDTLGGASSFGSPLTLDGGPGADRLSAGSGAATLLGGDGADVLEGGPRGDVLSGGAGDDVLFGAAGDDSLDGGTGADAIAGGSGRDAADYSVRGAPLRLTLDGVANDGAVGEGDLLAGDLERLTGGAGDDTLSGDRGDNELEGSGGDDVLFAAAGRDVLRGGPGADTADFSQVSKDLYLSVVEDDASWVYANAGENSIADDDKIEQVEIFISGSGDDRLTGDRGRDRLFGGPGDDVLDGADGSDVLSGGPGIDTTEYRHRRSGGVRVTLDGRADDGGPGEDDLVDTERVSGSDYPDVLIGGGAADALFGGLGADTIRGGGGADVVVGGAGSDDLGGDGGRDSIVAFDGARDRLACGDRLDIVSADGADDVSGPCAAVLRQVGSGRDLPSSRTTRVPAGDSRPRRLTGGRHADTLTGGGGRDMLSGRGGADRLRGGRGPD